MTVSGLIDATARIDPGATIGNDVFIGPYCVVGPNVSIGDGCKLISHVHIAGHTSIGARTRIAPFASLGGPPQSFSYRGSPTTLSVGENCDIREHVTINIGTEDGGGATIVGDRCLFMVNSHVGHDCRVGNEVIFANNAVLGGHVAVGDFVVFGGQVAVHQHVQIGEGAMVSGVSGVAADIIPFGVAIGQRAVLNGINIVGLKRRNTPRDAIRRVWRAYRSLFHGAGSFNERKSIVERESNGDPLVEKMLAFIRSPRQRPLMMSAPSRGGGDTDHAAS